MTKIKVTGKGVSLQRIAETFGISKRDQAQIRRTVDLVKAGKPSAALIDSRAMGGASHGKVSARRRAKIKVA